MKNYLGKQVSKNNKSFVSLKLFLIVSAVLVFIFNKMKVNTVVEAEQDEDVVDMDEGDLNCNASLQNGEKRDFRIKESLDKLLSKSSKYFVFLKLFLVASAAVVFYTVVVNTEEIVGHVEGVDVIGFSLSGLFVVASLIFALNKDVNNPVMMIFVLMMFAGLFAARGALLYFGSMDFHSFLSGWMTELRNASGISEAFGERIGNYNMPYLYILFILSRFDFSDLFLIKFASMVFDIILAYYAMKLVSLKTTRINLKILAFASTLAIPTVILNGAMWAQCDSIYSAFALGAIYYALAGKGKLAYVFLGLSFAFKMQAVFVMPLFIVFLFKKKLRFRDSWLFPVTFFGTLIPSIAFGMPIRSTLSVYIEQFDYFNALTANAISIWRLVGSVDQNHFISGALFFAGVIVVSLMYFIYVNKERITKTTDYIYIAYLFAVIMPFVLPKMHDRYLFIADVLSLLVFMYNKKRWYVPFITIFASYSTYVPYLMGAYVVIDILYITTALGVVILILLKDLVEKLYNKKEVY